MENFVVSARKYRPATFETVVGQESITTTLQNAISNQQLAQAYLFCGPRGVGKTTCARIFAKTINQEGEDGIAADDDFSFNLFELDAASNNSVDDIRNLTDQVRIPPQRGRYKVYIIDEVHMLSQAAFNAFLKTLEEPPPHAIFILATTEKHKIIPTILSRCQIFDFQRIQISDMMAHLGKIAEKESITTEPDALHVIAQKADGALRDALSIFDQLASFTGRELTYESVIRNLNILDYDYYFKVTDAMLGNNITGILLLFDDILAKGFDGHHFIVGLAEHFRNLLVGQDPATLKLLEVGDNAKTKYLEQAKKSAPDLLLSALELTSKADVQYRTSKNQRLLVEILLMQLCSLTLGEKKNQEHDLRVIAPPAAKPSQSTPSGNSAPKAQASAPPQRSQPSGPPPSAPIPGTPPPNSAPRSNQPVAKPKPIQAPPPGSYINTGSVSISNMMNPKAKAENGGVEEEEDLSNMPRDPYTKDQLLLVWRRYADLLRTKGKSSFSSTMTKREPEVHDDNHIVLIIDSQVAAIELTNEKSDMMQYLRRELNNYGIQLKHRLAQAKEEGKKLYTNREKFDHLAEQNPSLLELKKKLDLDLDH